MLKKPRWCQLKGEENLARHQRAPLRYLLRYNLKSVWDRLRKKDD